MKTIKNSELKQNNTSVPSNLKINSMEEAIELFQIEENVKAPEQRGSTNPNTRYLIDIIQKMPVDGRIRISFRNLNDYGIWPQGIRSQIQFNPNLKGRYKTKTIKDVGNNEIAFEIYCIA